MPALWVGIVHLAEATERATDTPVRAGHCRAQTRLGFLFTLPPSPGLGAPTPAGRPHMSPATPVGSHPSPLQNTSRFRWGSPCRHGAGTGGHRRDARYQCGGHRGGGRDDSPRLLPAAAPGLGRAPAGTARAIKLSLFALGRVYLPIRPGAEGWG